MIEKGLKLVHDIFKPKFHTKIIKKEKVQEQNDIIATENPEELFAEMDKILQNYR